MATKSKKTRRPRSDSALRITKVYTRTGDKGSTRLVGGQSVPKNHPRIAAYGTVDELSVAMGGAREAIHQLCDQLVFLVPSPRSDASMSLRRFQLLAEHLTYLQNQLFTVGSDLATRVEDRWVGMPLVGKPDITYLEKLIDAYNDDLPPLKDFILPGGGAISIGLHECRVICRRAERESQTLAELEDIGDVIIPYLNRLSDLFFVLGRWAAAEFQKIDPAEEEAIWNRELKRPPLPKQSKKKS